MIYFPTQGVLYQSERAGITPSTFLYTYTPRQLQPTVPVSNPIKQEAMKEIGETAIKSMFWVILIRAR